MKIEKKSVTGPKSQKKRVNCCPLQKTRGKSLNRGLHPFPPSPPTTTHGGRGAFSLTPQILNTTKGVERILCFYLTSIVWYRIN